MPLEKTEKLVRLCNAQGKRISGALQVVREHYLREDVPCFSALCLAGCQNIQDPLLPILADNLTHYLVPDCGVVAEYLEVLEDENIQGVILTKTVVQHIQREGGRRLYNRLQNLMKIPSKGVVTFPNEFQKYAYCPRQPNESTSAWKTRNVYSACEWYVNHLASQIAIVMLTTDDKVVDDYMLRNPGVHVLTLKKYLDAFLPKAKGVHELYESLTSSLHASATNDVDQTTYLSSEAIQSGIKTGILVQGTLNVNKHNAMHEAFVRPSGASNRALQEDVLLVGSSARNRAIHGDLVVTELLPKHLWRPRSCDLKENKTDGGERVMPTGRVVGVLQRRWRDYVASFEVDNQKRRVGKVLVVPMDWRIPKIRISTTQAEALRSHRIIVRLDNWEVGSQYPNGHFVRSLGPAGQVETEISAILIEHNLQVPPFADGLMSEMPVNTDSNPWVMAESEVKTRRDLRQSHLVFSIDPKGCEDVDDALSIRHLSNGKMELGVHIADVTHFVAANSLTDLEAKQRATTVYLADRRYDMLPAVLSADLCSLLSGVDRYAVSVIWTLDQDCQVLDVWYGRTVIHSSYKLFYEMAQSIHDGAADEEIIENVPELQNNPDHLKKKISELRSAVNSLMSTARKIQARRTRQGALQLEGVEVQVQIDKTSAQQNITDVIPKEALEIHETIAECMIFANHWVAKKICETYPNQALLRHHPLPRQEDFGRLQSCASVRGFSINTTDNKTLAESLDRCVIDGDATFNKLLRSLATQAMSNASYFSTGALARDQFFHYGLALPYYTHFTSPIRRYADILVHRQLLAAVKTAADDNLPSCNALQEMAEHINSKHKMSQDAQKESVRLFQCLYFASKPEDDDCRLADAVIFTVRANGLLVFVPRYGLRGAVYLRQKDGMVALCQEQGGCPVVQWVGGSLRASETSVSVNTPFGDQHYKLMDHITVCITVQESHAHSQELRMQLHSNQPFTSAAAQVDPKHQKAHIIEVNCFLCEMGSSYH
ncbi:hypothetical protein CAPTEDRAFT_108980 [Capitella teleta]|uniref:DIS3-like exonuclease 1 n=1 Tax=Capitella teleta TaxID=283909 RepID=R7V3H9_CAPTE|nr:hypothetical protein CAPTEDRAFT_108980 [Capitella teleta]|eukprot:ELU13403.1 hypothetical protein CAPTEDRAFT_108980 [Capitella teleta]